MWLHVLGEFVLKATFTNKLNIKWALDMQFAINEKFSMHTNHKCIHRRLTNVNVVNEIFHITERALVDSNILMDTVTPKTIVCSIFG